MKRKFSLNHLVKANKIKFKVPFSWYSIISTWFYIGKLPAPGTFGSIAAYPIFYYILMHSPSSSNAQDKLLLTILVLFIIGLIAVKKFQKTTNTYDHSYIVIDEVIGQLLTLYISLNWLSHISHLIPLNISEKNLIFLIALATFRYFDIKKPLIIDYVNRKYKGAFGVIFDDILAAIFASVSIYVVYLVANLFN
ncbi:MAG: phosphatidylglycerophosphatase A [Candidatus Midichloriaceae bacterium]